MTMTDEGRARIDRRHLLRRAIVLVGGTATVASLTQCLKVENAPRANSQTPRFFNVDRFRRLRIILDAMIPETDTPGALSAGVPQFIDVMMDEWASEQTRAQNTMTIDAIDAFANGALGHGLLSLAVDEQREAVRRFDAEAFTTGDGGYFAFKELALLGYYHSEVGATEELQYELVPGRWIACALQSEIGRAWAY